MSNDRKKENCPVYLSKFNATSKNSIQDLFEEVLKHPR
jgi:predicted HAD superfamily hydrolase